MPVLTAVRTNPWLRVYYERLIARGKLPKVALVAAIRKSLHAVYSVATRRRPSVQGAAWKALHAPLVRVTRRRTACASA
jgi:hypothetical protein